MSAELRPESISIFKIREPQDRGVKKVLRAMGIGIDGRVVHGVSDNIDDARKLAGELQDLYDCIDRVSGRGHLVIPTSDIEKFSRWGF